MSYRITCFARETGRARRGRGLRPLVRCLVLLLGALMGSAVPAAPAAAKSRAQLAGLGISAPTDPRNAATWYVRAMEALDTIDEASRHAVDDWDGESAPRPAMRRAVSAHSAALERTEAAAARTHCDFQLDREKGWDLVLPHLVGLRRLARVLRARAGIALLEGRADEAVHDIERIQRMSVHLAADDIPLSSLVAMAMAMASMADEMIDVGFRRGVFGPAEAAMLLDATQGLARPGAFRVRDAMAADRLGAAVTMRRNVLGASQDERAAFFEMWAGEDLASPGMRVFQRGSADQLGKEMEGLDRAYRAQEAVLAGLHERPDETLVALEAEEAKAGSGAYGALAMVFPPSITPAARQAVHVRQEMQARVAMLHAVIAGDDRASWLDAAVHLQAAIAAADEVNTEQPSDAAAASDRVLDELAAAAAADHFDEHVLWVDGDSLVVPAWTAGARRVLELLAGEVARHAAIDGPDASADAARLAAVGLRLVRHVASARSFAASRVAQEHLEQLVPLVQAMPPSGRDDSAQWRPLAAAAGGIVAERRVSEDGRGWLHDEDALLGYPATTVRLREIVAQAAADLRARIDGTPPLWGDASVAKALDGDMLANLTLATERVAGGGMRRLHRPHRRRTSTMSAAGSRRPTGSRASPDSRGSWTPTGWPPSRRGCRRSAAPSSPGTRRWPRSPARTARRWTLRITSGTPGG